MNKTTTPSVLRLRAGLMRQQATEIMRKQGATINGDLLNRYQMLSRQAAVLEERAAALAAAQQA